VVVTAIAISLVLVQYLAQLSYSVTALAEEGRTVEVRSSVKTQTLMECLYADRLYVLLMWYALLSASK